MTSNNKKFSFTSTALPADTFDVISFTGSEGLSKLYRFDVILISENDQIDLESTIQSRATLTILRENGDITFNGILSGFEQMGTVLGRTQYRAVLTPAFWRQTLTHHNQIFLNKTIPEIIEAAMKDGGLTSLDYKFNLTDSYLPREYVCQYNESHHSFISRLMEREGIYYYFEQGDGHEKVIITDTALLHTAMGEGMKMYYSPPSGLDETSREEVIKTLICSQKILPNKVVLKDYNYRNPDLKLVAEYLVSERGIGDVFIYGEHFSTQDEGARLAKVRAEALKCRARVFQGESLIPYLRPGYIFKLAGHNRKDFNSDYLTTDITHNGDQAFMLAAGLDEITSTRERSSYYRNSFTAITLECQFRPERITEKPRISGTLNAHIDAEGGGEYSEIDNQGRYKVILPFDLNSVKGGKASSWLRMAQPYAGDTHGMHFPLHKGTEVLLTFIDGDPDRPIIAAAVPNPLTPSPVSSGNASQSRITTAGGNKMHIEDQKGSEGMLLQTPKSNTTLRLGLAGKKSESSTNAELQEQIDDINADLAAEKAKEAAKEAKEAAEEANSGISIFTDAGMEITSKWENSLTLGECTEVTVGSVNDIVIGSETAITVGSAMEIFLGTKMDLTVANTVEYYLGNIYSICAENELTGQESVLIKAGGTSPAIWGAVTAMLALTAASTVAATAMGKASKENATTITLVNESISGLNMALSLVLNTALCRAADKVLYASTIELKATEIEVKSPKVIIKGVDINVGNALALTPPVAPTATLNLNGAKINIGDVAKPATTDLNLTGIIINIGNSPANTTTMNLKAGTMNIGEGGLATNIKGTTLKIGDGSTTTSLNGTTVTIGEGSTTTSLNGTTVKIGETATTVSLKGQSVSFTAMGDFGIAAQLIKLG